MYNLFSFNPYTPGEIAKAWAIVILQILLIIVLLIIAYHIFRIVRAYSKRRKTIKALYNTAEQCDYIITKNKHCFALFKNYSNPYITIKANNVTYNIRFIPCIGRNRIVHFITPNIYTKNKMFGFLIISKGALSNAIARLFKPKNIPGTLLKDTHSEMVEIPKRAKLLPNLEIDISDGQEQKEIVIFNPVPIRAFCIVNQAEKQIIGGETYNGVGYHDTDSFCAMLIRSKKA